MEPRQVTRIEVAKWAREAYNLGIRYIGGKREACTPGHVMVTGTIGIPKNWASDILMVIGRPTPGRMMLLW